MTRPVLTLEPLLEAVSHGVASRGWSRSGLQKTTSQEFEGRWQGESTRSAYLFFHDPGAPEGASLDVYLDETSRGLQGNLSLVLDGPELAALGGAEPALTRLAAAVSQLPGGERAALSLRLRLASASGAAAEALVEARFRLPLPAAAIAAGSAAVSEAAGETAVWFRGLLAHPEVRAFVEQGS